MIGEKIPHIVFKTRVGDEEPIGGGCPIGGVWKDVTTEDLFGGKLVILFSLPGAFTPTCSTYQLPGFENDFEEFQKQGVDEIYCSSVNDSFVMNEWSNKLGIKNVKVIPDGNGELASALNMFADFSHNGFGGRSKRFAAVIRDGVVVAWFPEPEATETVTDPYGESSPENVMGYLKQGK
jgi:peroxiredoxin